MNNWDKQKRTQILFISKITPKNLKYLQKKLHTSTFEDWSNAQIYRRYRSGFGVTHTFTRIPINAIHSLSRVSRRLELREFQLICVYVCGPGMGLNLEEMYGMVYIHIIELLYLLKVSYKHLYFCSDYSLVAIIYWKQKDNIFFCSNFFRSEK